MSVRVNKPQNPTTPTVFLLVHGGFDFDPTTLAVCSSLEQAEKMRTAHYAVPENKDYPWNSVWVVETHLDDWVDYQNDEEPE